jgi:hypothetical protein
MIGNRQGETEIPDDHYLSRMATKPRTPKGFHRNKRLNDLRRFVETCGSPSRTEHYEQNIPSSQIQRISPFYCTTPSRICS